MSVLVGMCISAIPAFVSGWWTGNIWIGLLVLFCFLVFVITPMRMWKEQTDRLKDEKALDQLLNKVSELGIDALTNQERKQLKKISKRKRLKDTEPADD